MGNARRRECLPEANQRLLRRPRTRESRVRWSAGLKKLDSPSTLAPPCKLEKKEEDGDDPAPPCLKKPRPAPKKETTSAKTKAAPTAAKSASPPPKAPTLAEAVVPGPRADTEGRADGCQERSPPPKATEHASTPNAHASATPEHAAPSAHLPQEGDADAGGGSPTTALASQDKRQYNKFVYRLGGCPEEVKEEWARLLKEKDKECIDAFMEIVAGSKKGNLPSDFIAKCKKTENVESKGDYGEWAPWKEVSDKEGHDALLEMVAAGSVVVRRHINLPPNSKIQYPYNQQVAYVRQKWSKVRRLTEEEQSMEHGRSPEEFEATYAAHKRDMAQGSNFCTQANTAPPPHPPPVTDPASVAKLPFRTSAKPTLCGTVPNESTLHSQARVPGTRTRLGANSNRISMTP